MPNIKINKAKVNLCNSYVNQKKEIFYQQYKNFPNEKKLLLFARNTVINLVLMEWQKDAGQD